MFYGFNIVLGDRLMDCRELEFDPQKSDERIKRALRVFNPKVFFKILAFALYMFGAKRKIIGSKTGNLRIPAAHKIQVRAVLLSLLNSGLLSTDETALVLGISAARCRELARKLACDDIGESLIDKRMGQLQDFRVGPTQKAEIIRQFAARTVSGHSTSSEVLTELIKEQTQTELSPRTVRWHMNKLGLTSIKKLLPELVDALKKSS